MISIDRTKETTRYKVDDRNTTLSSGTEHAKNINVHHNRPTGNLELQKTETTIHENEN
jgi:hypothetical protein